VCANLAGAPHKQFAAAVPDFRCRTLACAPLPLCTQSLAAHTLPAIVHKISARGVKYQAVITPTGTAYDIRLYHDDNFYTNIDTATPIEPMMAAAAGLDRYDSQALAARADASDGACAPACQPRASHKLMPPHWLESAYSDRRFRNDDVVARVIDDMPMAHNVLYRLCVTQAHA
jgi:hypothetical protein